MAEDLTEYYTDLGIRVRYLHSDIKTLERIDIIQDLRMGEFDVLVGINLLREGLDIPEVSLVAILDADKEGFLRSTRSLIQTCGRAARNVRGTVLMYGDTVTDSMQRAADETTRRREIQAAYNKKHTITPMTVDKKLGSGFEHVYERSAGQGGRQVEEKLSDYTSLDNLEGKIASLEKEMNRAARDLEFEKAAALRDRIRELQKLMVFDFEASS
ncbi:MAG TPA: helicase-related protein, partial [Desulfosalsimonadaceae bacterium]|nr:helicase-related protein [Desulfosalsimonadaceae bacterium]